LSKDAGKSVESAEKDGAEAASAGDAVEEVTEGIKQAALQTS
jgi:methionyl-tRNA synthetase